MSKYIRTKDGIFEFKDFHKECLNHYGYTKKNGINVLMTLSEAKEHKVADTIEELCDEFVLEDNSGNKILGTLGRDTFWNNYYSISIEQALKNNFVFYGAIWTDKGLIYVAKMNKKGELELL